MNKSSFNVLLGIAIAVFIGAWFYSGTIKSQYASAEEADPAAIQARLRPMGDAVVTGAAAPAAAARPTVTPAVPATSQAPVPATTTPVQPTAAAAAPASSLGKDTYASACFACHTTGVAGSPKLGDTAVWAPRIAQGMDTLNEHAIKGFQGDTGMMPPKGGRLDLSDEAIKAAVAYMVEESS